MSKLLWIGCGGAVGAVLRYLVASGAQRLSQDAFPIGTLTVNAIGCVGIGVLVALLTGPLVLREELRLALLVGFLGGFTTFSTFGYETFVLLNDGEWWRAALYAIVTNAICLAAVWGGYRLTVFWPWPRI